MVYYVLKVSLLVLKVNSKSIRAIKNDSSIIKIFWCKIKKKTYHIPFRLPLCFTHIYVAIFTEMLPELRLPDYLFKTQNVKYAAQKTRNFVPVEKPPSLQ